MAKARMKKKQDINGGGGSTVEGGSVSSRRSRESFDSRSEVVMEESFGNNSNANSNVSGNGRGLGGGPGTMAAGRTSLPHIHEIPNSTSDLDFYGDLD